jgi:hypothetical protein
LTTPDLLQPVLIASALMMGRLLAVAAVAPSVCGLTWPHHVMPPTHVPRAAIQSWDVSTLREQIKAQHVEKVAFHSDAHAVEVLDINSIHRTVRIFPSCADALVEDMRSAKVDFFVLPEFGVFSAPLTHFARGFILMMATLALVQGFGLTDDAIWLVSSLGLGGIALMSRVNAAIDDGLHAAQKVLSKPKRPQQIEPCLLPIDRDDADVDSLD